VSIRGEKIPMLRTIFGLTLLILIISCDQNDCNEKGVVDAFVIGYDQCTGVFDPNGGNVGLILRIPSTSDTVVTYNFPKGLYTFPPEYFSYYQFYCFFPDSTLSNFQIKLSYRIANNNEKEYPLCRADINLYYFNKYVKDRQIIIECVTKTD